MSIDVGTLVKKYEYKEDLVGYMLCESYTTDEEYEETYQRKLDVCIGMVMEAILDEDEVIVTWVHMCRYHTTASWLAQTGEHPDYLWEVGQL